MSKRGQRKGNRKPTEAKGGANNGALRGGVLATERMIALVCLALLLASVLAIGGATIERWFAAVPATPTTTASTLQGSGPSLAKEYMYGPGGKLISTEEPQPTCTVSFNDVFPTTPYYADICAIASIGITLGCNANPPLYCPDSPVTRAQMAIFIERSLGIPNPPVPTSQRFTDVPPTHYAYAFIDDFARRGITNGCDVNIFCPESSVTHEQMAAFMERAVGRFQPPTPPSQPTFCDVPAGSIFYAFIEDLFVRGVWAGCDGVGTGSSCQNVPGCTTASKCFCPTRAVTRAEMARILVRNFNGFPPVPSAPTGVTATPGNAQVTLSWNASTGATSYKVRRSTTSGSGYIDVATVTSGTSYLDAGLTNGTTYYYVIAAVNSNGSVGLNSAQVSATPAS